jgi:hypothetical protein
MLLLILLALAVLLLFGFGFAVHLLWIAAVIALVILLVSFFVGAGRRGAV